MTAGARRRVRESVNSKRTRALALCLAAAVLGVTSCVPPPFFRQPDYAPIPGIQAGMTSEQVSQALGEPSTRAKGWWVRSYWFDMDYEVWYYKYKGRVIFDIFNGKVSASELDAEQSGQPH